MVCEDDEGAVVQEIVEFQYRPLHSVCVTFRCGSIPFHGIEGI